MKRISIIFAIALAVAFGVYKSVQAMPGFVIPDTIYSTSGYGTSTTVWITPGTATTTVAADTSDVYQYGSGDSYVGDSATISIELTATNTQPVLKFRPEIASIPPFTPNATALDCSATQSACDWFPMLTPTNTSATTTSLAPSEYQFSIATTTGDVPGSGTGTTTKIFASYTIPNVPARFIRFKVYDPIGGAPGALFVQLVVKKQTNKVQ